jgi:transcriptional regulator with XRE-family HTH domain
MSKLNNKPMRESIGARIRTARLSRGLATRQLAESIGVTRQQMCRYESARNDITAPCLARIARALKLPLGCFFEDIELPDSMPLAGTSQGRLALFQAYEKLDRRNRSLLISIAHSMVEATVSAC